jgi:hypothetical protein
MFRVSRSISALVSLLPIFTICLVAGLYSTAAAQNNASFTSRSTSTKVFATAVATIDLNGDGIPDLIESYARIEPVLFSVQLGLGNGWFAPAVDYTAHVNQQYAVQILTADVNNDGKADVIVLTGKVLLVYLGRGDGTLIPPQQYALPSFPEYAAVADFNHDGIPDLVFSLGSTISVVYGDGKGAFSAPAAIATLSSDQGVDSIAVGDFDADANADVAVAVTHGTCSPYAGCAGVDVHILYGNGAGSFTDKLVYPGIVGDINFYSGDLNNDGKTDLIANLIRPTSMGQNLLVLYGQTSRAVTATYLQTDGYFVPPPPFVIADLNGDGRNDLAVLTQSATDQLLIEIFFGAGNSTFKTEEIVIEQAPADYGPLLVGDFYRDRRPDLLLTSGDRSDSIFQVFDYMNTTPSTFSPCLYPDSAGSINACVFRSGTNDATVRLDASAAWFEPLRKLELWVDGVKVTEQRNVWDKYAWLDYSHTYGPGTHRADFFSAGYDNTLQHQLVTFAVPGAVCAAPSSPGVNVCSPANRATVTSPVRALAGGAVPGSIQRMEVWADSMKMFSTFGSNQLDATIAVPKGKHVLSYFIENTNGTTWLKQVSLTVH